MTDAPNVQQQPAPPANAIEAQARFDTLTGDKAWTDRFLNGDLAAVNEFHTLTGVIANGGSAEDVVASVMDGKVPAFGSSIERQMAEVVEQNRAIGISDAVTKQFLSGEQVSPQEYQAVANLKRELMGDEEWVKKFLAGDVKAKQQLRTIDQVLVNGIIKAEKAA